ncbi:MAG TPA: class I SAM-dependent methyltransferase [Chitinophagales bacterium]|nr:class I SAM-dependent methyltransferase [Chitinophagales bacterium]HNO27580.1 class I SAM-dependent methyltransferase [Chitinophagales bacterium]
MEPDYISINRKAWNDKVDAHVQSEFYNVAGFLNGETSLKHIELELLGDISGKRILHLQCHFGQDTISLARMGAYVTGVDLSDVAIAKAKELAVETGASANFVCCNIYDLAQHISTPFDIVFTSYGTIGWLPDLKAWAALIRQFLKADGKLIFVEFHPAVWMFDDDFKEIKYNYFNTGIIEETEEGTYADRDADIHNKTINWNHGISEVVQSLLDNDLSITGIHEYDHSPWPCFKHMESDGKESFYIKHIGKKIPMVYAITAERKV